MILTQTEVDNSNKTSYGETGMYLFSAAGNFGCRVTLDEEGLIHDFEEVWGCARLFSKKEKKST